MESSHKKSPKPTKGAILSQAFDNARVFLNHSNQPFAVIRPHNTVPLFSEAFYTHLFVEFENKSLPPSSANYNYVRRLLDNTIHNLPVYQPVYLRSAKIGPASYKIDLHDSSFEVVNLTADGWKIEQDFNTHFYTPESSWPLKRPIRIKEKLCQCVEKTLKLPETEAKQIAKWLVSAFLQDETTSALIITGKARHEATKKLRQLLDPVANAMLEIPHTAMQMAQLAITNKVLAFSMYEMLPKGKIEAINKIRTGTEVVLKDSSKLRPPIRESMQRPVIISAHVAPQIHEGQLTIEVNESIEGAVDEMFGALLNAACVAMRVFTVKSAPAEFHREAPEPELEPEPVDPDPDGPGP